MPLAMIAAACLAAQAAPAAGPGRVDNSLSDQGRLSELQIEVRSAYRKGEIDRAAAGELELGIARVRRQLIIMGIQVSYRQRVRLRARIDGLYARLAERRTRGGAQLRSGK